MQCRNGSPANCEIEIVSVKRYSTGSLVKVINGTEVRKSTEQSSCPAGWKIWSPHNKADWTAVYEALGKKTKNYPQKPGLIVDVTREYNGCGGCSNFPMNSRVVQQSSWKTTDGSAWWLRDTAYKEPRGSYIENCYLHVKDANPNNVQFKHGKHGKCIYSSTDYLCQMARPRPGMYVGKDSRLQLLFWRSVCCLR